MTTLTMHNTPNFTLTRMANYMNDLLNSDAPLGSSSSSYPSASSTSEKGFSASKNDTASGSSNNLSHARYTETVSTIDADLSVNDSQEDAHISDKPVFRNTTQKTKTKSGDNTLKGITPLYNRSWFRPAAIGVGVGLVGLSAVAFMIGGGDEPQVAAASGSADVVAVDFQKDGRDQLSPEQAKFLAEQSRLRASAQAEEGVTNAAIVTNPTASVATNTYLDENVSDMTIVTRGKRDIPLSMAQLEKNERLEKSTDSYGNVSFKDTITGEVFIPSDAEAYKQAAMYNTNYQAPNQGMNGGGGNQNYSNGGGQGGGGNNGYYSGDYQDNNNYQDNNGYDSGQQAMRQPERQPDPYLGSARESLRNEYNGYTEQQAQNQAYISQRENELRQNQQQTLQARQQQAQQSFNSSLSGSQAQGEARRGFSSLNYNRPQNQNSQGQGQNYNSQGQGQDYQNQGNGNDNGSGSNSNNFGGNYTSNNVTLSPDGELVNQSTQRNTGASAQLTADGKIPPHIIRAGERIPVIITKAVNTDEGGRVTGEVVSGKFRGAKVYGSVVPTARSVGVRFTHLAPPNPRKPIIPINAIAATVVTDKEAIATNVKRHYARNYGVLALTSVLEGYGAAYEGVGQKSIVTDSGSVVTVNSGEIDNERIRGEVIGRLGQRLTQDVSRQGERPPTYFIAQGTLVNMVLTNNLDTTAVATDIGIGSR